MVLPLSDEAAWAMVMAVSAKFSGASNRGDENDEKGDPVVVMALLVLVKGAKARMLVASVKHIQIENLIVI